MRQVLLAVLMVLALPAWALAETAGPAPAAAEAEARVPQSAAEVKLSFAPVVRRAAPAVVNIYAKRLVADRRAPLFRDPFFQDFFRDFAPARPRVQNSLGSGVILSPEGLVVSNHHVIADASDIRVVLNDRREYSAEVLLADEESDLAVLRLDGAKDLPHLPLRAAPTVEVGELVLAIGNPFGVGQTVTSGIVSGLARSGGATGDARGYFIQTDASINPGNSGGALIDVDGRVIGINTSILSRSGGSNGIGFAIPADLVAQFLAQAKEGARSFQRPWAGMTGQPVDADLAAGFGLPLPGGMVIAELHSASAFARAGLRGGDVVTAVDGQPVNGPAEMLHRLSVAGIGAAVTVDYLRGGAPGQLRVTLEAAPEQPPRAPTRFGTRDFLPGLLVANVNPALIVEMGLPLLDGGVAVLDPGPYGRRLGLREKDVVIAVDGRKIERVEDLRRALNAASGRLDLRLQRGARRLSLRIGL